MNLTADLKNNDEHPHNEYSPAHQNEPIKLNKFGYPTGVEQQKTKTLESTSIGYFQKMFSVFAYIFT
jgi:hypothetical protein